MVQRNTTITAPKILSQTSTEETENEKENYETLKVPFMITHTHVASTNNKTRRDNNHLSISKDKVKSKSASRNIESPQKSARIKKSYEIISKIPQTRNEVLVNVKNAKILFNSTVIVDNHNTLTGKLDTYNIIRVIGEGAYARVKGAFGRNTKKMYAVKIYQKYNLKEAFRIMGIRNEINSLNELRHPNIVLLFETVEVENYICLVQEYLCGQSLQLYAKSKYQRKIKEDEAKKIFKQIASAILYCHEKSICHRDIKMDNIIINKSGTVKLIDFGFSIKVKKNEKLKHYCGTPTYMSPQIASKIPYDGRAADMWALGVLLYGMVAGCYPFKAASNNDLYARISKGSYMMPSVSFEAKNLISNLLIVDAESRYTAEQVIAHSFLKDQ